MILGISQELRYLLKLKEEAGLWTGLPEGTDPVHYEVDHRIDAILTQMEANMDGSVDMPPESVHDNSPMTKRERRHDRDVRYRQTHKKIKDPVTGKARWVKREASDV